MTQIQFDVDPSLSVSSSSSYDDNIPLNSTPLCRGSNLRPESVSPGTPAAGTSPKYC